MALFLVRVGICLAPGLATAGQNTGALVGQVRDMASENNQNQGILGVTVKIISATGQEVESVLTDENGRYKADGIPAGNLTVEYRHLDYIKYPERRNSSVSPGQTVTLDVELVSKNITSAYSKLLARKLNTAAQEEGGAPEDYAEQWNSLKERGISPLALVYLGQELASLQPRVFQVPEIGPYVATKPARVQQMYDKFRRAIQEGSVPTPDVANDVPDEVVGDVIRYLMVQGSVSAQSNAKFHLELTKTWAGHRNIELIKRRTGGFDP